MVILNLISVSKIIAIEVKTESYTHNLVAIEQYSNFLTKSVGGMFQYQSKKNDFIIHVFYNNMAILFNVNKLVSFLVSPRNMEILVKDCIDAKYFVKHNYYTVNGEKRITHWVTTGWSIPLSFFPTDILTLIDLNKETDIGRYLIKS